MKAILIDSNNQTLSWIEIENDFREIYRVIDCEDINLINIDHDHHIYVDGEGMLNLNPASRFFRFCPTGWSEERLIMDSYAIPGNGIVLGTNPNDSSDEADCTLTIEWLKERITFMNIREALALAQKQEDLICSK